jgi:hypothetical protein
MLSGDIKFAIKPTIDIMVAAQTPFNGYKNVKASVSHQATDMKRQRACVRERTTQLFVSFKWCCDSNICTFSWLIYQEISRCLTLKLK